VTLSPELYAELDGVTLCYDVSGPEQGEPLVLISGHGEQMIGWQPAFCALLVEEGFRVVRFDNRDVGLSTKFESADPATPYTLGDMAGDVVKLIAFLGYDSAHIVGRSMGGMIAQQLALSFSHQVRSMCCIFAMPSLEFLVNDPEMQELLSRPPAGDRDGAIRQYVERKQLTGSGYDAAWLTEYAETVYDRSYYPAGAARHSAAFAQQRDRLPELAKLELPSAVIHGRDDRLLSYEGSIATAAAIPDAELHVYSGMGHDMRSDLWPEFVRVIARTAARAAPELRADDHRQSLMFFP
jgi:pimeloyl-ACP methyl ester carboxylesterase